MIKFFAMVQVVNGRPLTAEARFQSWANSWLICIRKNGTDKGFSKIMFSHTTCVHSHSSIHLSPRCIIPAIESVFKQNTKVFKITLNGSRCFSIHHTKISDSL